MTHQMTERGTRPLVATARRLTGGNSSRCCSASQAVGRIHASSLESSIREKEAFVVTFSGIQKLLPKMLFKPNDRSLRRLWSSIIQIIRCDSPCDKVETWFPTVNTIQWIGLRLSRYCRLNVSSVNVLSEAQRVALSMSDTQIGGSKSINQQMI